MKKTMPFFLLLLSACSTSKNVADSNNQIIKSHSQPVKIFGIGNYRSNSIILTLVDAQNQYFIIEAPKEGAFKVGDVYP